MWLPERFKYYLQRIVHPLTSDDIKRQQILWFMAVVVCLLIMAYGVSLLIFDRHAKQSERMEKKPTPTQIESGSTRADTEQAWRYKIETDLGNLETNLKALQVLLEEAIKDRQDQTHLQEWEDRFSRLEATLETRNLAQSPQANLNEDHSSSPHFQGEDQNTIHKFTLTLKDSVSSQKLKTVDTTIPAGAFAKTVLLSGLDAPAAMNAASDPRPMLLRIVDYGTLPRRFQSDLKDCHCTAGAYGDLSSERVYARLEKLTCVVQKTGEIIETQVAGYIAGPDGKAGIRGVVASKDGELLTRSLVGGMFAGLSNVANPQNRRVSPNPFTPGGAGVPPISMGENFASGMASGASSALDRLSQYYIDRAEQLQPVIQVAAGQVVDIVFTEGTFIGSQSIKQELEATRSASKSQISHPPSQTGNEP